MASTLSQSQIALFAVVGVFNTALCYSVYVALLWLGLAYALSNFLALVFGVLVGFRTQGTFVFRNRNGGRFFWFLVVWCTIYFFSVSLIALLVERGLDPYSAGAIALVPVAGLSYLLQRYFVFARHTA